MKKVENAWYRVSVKAVIYNQHGDILLCRESNGLWDLPGGGLDHGEKYDTCIKRELMEEMGLKVVSIQPKPLCFLTAHKPQSNSRPWISNICYVVEVADLNISSSDECVEVGFFSVSEMQKIDIIENVQEFIKVVGLLGK